MPLNPLAASGTAAGIAASQAAATAGQNNVAASTDQLFSNLLPMSWRAIEVPYEETSIELRQDLAIHKFSDRDGAHIEGTGRAPLQFRARIPFINGLSRGLQESWVQPLYPLVWRQFFAACADRTTGLFIQPELGEFKCKVESFSTTWSATRRGGVDCNVVWLETDDSIDELGFDLASPSPLANAQQAAGDLDSDILNLDPAIVPQPYVPPFSFSDLMMSIRAVTDIPTLLSKEFAGRIDNFIYQAQQLEDSLNRAENASPLNWPMFQSAELGKSACYDLKATQIAKARPVSFYRSPKDCTLAQISGQLNANIVDIMTLNPAYVQTPVVPANSIVRFYTPTT